MGRFNNLSYTTSYFFYVDNERGLNKISSLMEILTNKEEVREKLKNNPLQAAHLLRLNGYGSIKYECACGETHDANGKDVSCKGSAKPFKALLKCANNFMTMIKIEGFFRKKAISEYGFKASIMAVSYTHLTLPTRS